MYVTLKHVSCVFKVIQGQDKKTSITFNGRCGDAENAGLENAGQTKYWKA